MRIHPVIQMWRGYVDYGTMPRSGGWEDQPLPLLVTFAVLSFAESTWRNYRQENFNWSKFSRTQLDFITWAEKELALG